MLKAIRSLRRDAGLTITAVLVLGLGIGSVTAIYSVVDALVVHPLAIRQLDRVAALWDNVPSRSFSHNEMSGPDFIDERDQSRSFASLDAIGYRTFNLTGTGQPLRITGAGVTSSYFESLGTRALIGRTFTRADDQPANHIVILSTRLWLRQFGADSSIIGRTLTLNSLPYTVVGVAPPGVEYPAVLDMWTPLATADLQREARGNHYLLAIGRLAPGVTLASARAEQIGIKARLATAYAASNTGHSATVAPLRDDVSRNVAPALFVLGASVLVLLLIGCTNVANLLLTRAASRQHEMALRSSLGATRGRLVRQLMLEALVLAVGGGILGVFIAIGGVRLAKGLIPAQQGQFIVGYQTLHAEPGILLAVALLSLATAIGVGMLPAIYGSRATLATSRVTGDRRSSRTRQAFVVAEVSLALLLLVAAGLMVKSYGRLIAVDPGFRIDNIVTADVALPRATYGDSAHQVQFWNNVVARLQSSPGIVSAAAAENVPLCQCNSSTGFTIVGAPAPLPGQMPEASYHTIVPGYFATLGIPLKRGRDIDLHDGVNGHGVVVVNQAFVDKWLAGRDPLTTQIQIDMLPPVDIVGVVGNARQFGYDQPAPVEMYLPLPENATQYMTLVVRTAGDPRTAVPAIRAAVAAVDPNQPLARVITMEEAARLSTFLQTLALELLLAFAIVATLLSGLGIYGVISFSVGQRTREMGIRSALGAQPVALLRLIVGQGIVPVNLGVCLGLIAAVLATRALGALLYGVSPTDLPTFAGVAVFLGAIGVIACYLPARRAARVDPVVALRSE